jgi:hypothetical protein
MALGRAAKNVVYKTMGKMKYVGGKIKNHLRESDRLNTLAKEKMDERYGEGNWSDSPLHISEMMKFKKQIKRAR